MQLCGGGASWAASLVLLLACLAVVASASSPTHRHVDPLEVEQPSDKVWVVVQRNYGSHRHHYGSGKGEQGHSSAKEGWAARHEATNRRLMLTTDFRGDYGSFRLIVSDADAQLTTLSQQFERLSFRPIAAARPHEQLWVLECTAEQNLIAVESLLQAGIFIYATAPNRQGGYSYVVKADQMPVQIHLSKITAIPVPTQAMIPVPTLEQSPLAAVLLNRTAGQLSPDPRVVQLLQSVSRQNLIDYLDSLTAINSRLSTSPTAIEATKLLEAHYTKTGLSVHKYTFRNGYSDNVIAELKGSEDPSKVVLFGAHYDCRAANIQDPVVRAPGADDNGSGTVAVMELARAFAASGLRFKYTIRFCSWSGEEQGILGSRDYARLMKANGVDIVAALNADMIGWRNPRTGLIMGLVTRLTTEWLTQTAHEVSKQYLPSLPVGFSSQACCSDQQSFLEQGYPAMSFFESTGGYVDYPQYHKSTDLPQYVDYDQLEQITKSAAALLATLATPLA